MRKMLRTLVFGVVIATPLLLVPHQSKAGNIFQDIGKIIHDLLDGKDNKHKSTTPGTSNSVPLNEGTVFLVIAGLGLGVKMIYDRRKQVENAVI